MYDRVIRLLSAGLGLGYMPVAPGTFGTLLGCVLFYCLRHESQTHIIVFSLVLAVVSIIIAHLGEKSFGKKDCQIIVIDEVAGVMFCYMFVPYSIFNLVLGFILFRIFDVAKLYPADLAQRKLKGGLGVVGDDLVAGIQGGVILYALPHLLKWVGVGLDWVG